MARGVPGTGRQPLLSPIASGTCRGQARTRADRQGHLRDVPRAARMSRLLAAHPRALRSVGWAERAGAAPPPWGSRRRASRRVLAARDANVADAARQAFRVEVLEQR